MTELSTVADRIERDTPAGTRLIHVEALRRAVDGEAHPTFIAVHGGPGFTSATMRSGMTALARHVPVTVFDLPGCGGSSRHPGNDYPLDDFVDDLAAVVDATAGDGIVLVAHAWGAILAVAWALRAEPRLRGLVLVNPLRILSEAGQDSDAQHRRIEATDPTLIPRFRAMAGLLERARAGDADAWRAFDESDWPREMFATQFAGPVPHDWKRDIDGAALGYESYNAYKGAALYDDGSSWAQFDLATWAARIEVPVLIVASDDDANYVAPAARHARPLAASLRHVTLDVQAGSGHFPFAEDPATFAHRVVAWRAGLDDR